MSDNALNIKYRPRSLAGVIGQPVVVTTLTNSFKAKNMHHGYIFLGKFGCGKTSVARILAAMQNCSEGPTLEPCGKCRNCTEIFAGKSLDVKEMDAASNRGIDDIRNLVKEARYSPVDCRVKIFIIDEAHSLTGTAAEAMLKLIEEPPPNVMFILATTDGHLLKDTIFSRCISLKFQKVSPAELFDHLKMVAAAEKIDAEELALKLAANSSDGSVRNSLVNLQKLVQYAGGKKITVEDAKKALGAIDDRVYTAFVEAIVSVNMPAGMVAIEALLRDGRTADVIVNGFHNHLRNLLIPKVCKDNLSALGFAEDEIKRFQHESAKLGVEFILEMMRLLVEVNAGLKHNLDPQILLEKFMIECVIWQKKAEAKAKLAAAKK